MVWFPQSPSVRKLPLPVLDPKRPWGSTECISRSGFCAGHYLEPEEVIAQLKSDNPSVNIDPPSIQLKEFFVGPEPTDGELEEIAANCLLPKDDVVMWLQHLKTIQENRKRGASKAAETRKKSYRCGICNALYGNTDEVEWMIGCDGWFHGECVNIYEPDKFYCVMFLWVSCVDFFINLLLQTSFSYIPAYGGRWEIVGLWSLHGCPIYGAFAI